MSLWGHHHGGELLQAEVPALGTKTTARGLLSTPGPGVTWPHSGCPGLGTDGAGATGPTGPSTSVTFLKGMTQNSLCHLRQRHLNPRAEGCQILLWPAPVVSQQSLSTAGVFGAQLEHHHHMVHRAPPGRWGSSSFLFVLAVLLLLLAAAVNY